MTSNAKGNNVKKLLDEAAELQSTEEASVPAQAEEPTGEKVETKRGDDGKLHILVTDEETEEPGKLKKLIAGAKAKVKKNKKALIGGGVAVLAIALGVTVQKKRSTTDESDEQEPAVVEPSEG